MDFWKDKRVVVTGATGFIGRNLVEALHAHGAYVICLFLDNEHLDFPFHGIHVINGSMTDRFSFERAIGFAHPDIVFHLAAQAFVGTAQRVPLATIETNVMGSAYLLDACRIIGGPKAIILASTDKVYGRHDILPYSESFELRGNEQIYEASKLCEDVLAHAYRESYGLPIHVTRCGNVFGKYDVESSRLIPSTIRSFLKRTKPIIRSDGMHYRDYVYVDDVVKGYMLLAETECHGGTKNHFAFNFGTMKPSRDLDVVYTIRELLGPEYENIEPKILGGAKDEIEKQYLDGSLAQSVLGWMPMMTLRAGLSETIAWHKEQKEKSDE